jgi:two-component system chemotaxis response regulator CheY
MRFPFKLALPIQTAQVLFSVQFKNAETSRILSLKLPVNYCTISLYKSFGGYFYMKLDNAKILIGDDSILARKQLKDIISSFGAVSFIEAANGQEAIDLYKSEKPDIVFLDIVMPIKDGIAAVNEIIQSDSNAHIIIVSSVGTQSQLKMAIEAGADDFIQKPLDRVQLQRLLSKHFDGR